MTRWVFSDGTVAKLGGNVEGGTAFAQALREEIADPSTLVGLGPIPGPSVPLDVNDPAIFDRFLKDEMTRPFRSWMHLGLLEAPEVPPLPAVEDEDDDVDVDPDSPDLLY
jgi:hypothetical protein